MQKPWKTLVGILFYSILFAGISLFHVWNRHQVSFLGRKITQEIKYHNYLEEENKNLNRNLSSLSNTQRIELMAKAILKMHMPKTADVVILKGAENIQDKVLSLSSNINEL